MMRILKLGMYVKIILVLLYIQHAFADNYKVQKQD